MLRRASLVLALILLATTALAQPPSRELLLQVEDEQRGREEMRQAWRAQATVVRREIEQVKAQLAELDAAEAAGEDRISDSRLRLAALNVLESELAARAGANQNQLSRMLGALQTFSRDPPPALFVHPADARDAVRAAILIRALTPELERRARAFATEADELTRVRREAAGAAEELFTRDSSIAQKRAELERALADKTKLERSLGAEILIAEREIAALAVRAKTLRTQVKDLPPLKAVAPTAAVGPPQSLRAPVAGPPVRRFGEPERDGRRAEGWAWRPAPGAPVLAPAAGVVEHSGPIEGLGNVLIVRLNGGYHLVLAGMDTVLTVPGQSVAAGQPVGRMANNGGTGVGSQAYELQMEVRRRGEPVDPARFMQ